MKGISRLEGGLGAHFDHSSKLLGLFLARFAAHDLGLGLGGDCAAGLRDNWVAFIQLKVVYLVHTFASLLVQHRAIMQDLGVFYLLTDVLVPAEDKRLLGVLG